MKFTDAERKIYTNMHKRAIEVK